MKLSKKHFGRIAILHSKNLLGEAPKNLKKSLGKSIQTKNIEKTFPKKSHHWRVAIKVWVSMPFLELSGGVCGVEKEYAFWSASVDFHALFGLVEGGGRRGKRACILEQEISITFLGFLGKVALEKGQAV